MRFFLTILIWVVIIGGLWSYERKRSLIEAKTVQLNPFVAQAEAAYSLSLTPTFSIEADPFALQVDVAGQTAIDLRLNGNAVIVEEDTVQRGMAWTKPALQGLVVGDNEIYIKASPPIAESDLQHGVRIQLTRDGVTVVDRTVWSQEGSLVSGSIHFTLEAESDTHDH